MRARTPSAAEPRTGATVPGEPADDGPPASLTRTRHIVLLGLMGAGKTTVGRALAAELHWPFRDSDADIEAAEGVTVRALRDRLGVEAMHAVEARHLLHALAAPGPDVVCAAASAIELDECRAALGAPDVIPVWLRADPGLLAERFGSSTHRPPHGDDPAVFLAEQAARRAPLFAAVEPVTIDVDGLAEGDVLARIRAAIGGMRAH